MPVDLHLRRRPQGQPSVTSLSPRRPEAVAETTCRFPLMIPGMTDLQPIHDLRRLLSGFSHRCRNSLNGMKMSLYLFRREVREKVPPNWGELERTYQKIEVLFDHLQTIYRPMALTMVCSSLGQLIGERAPKWRSSLQTRGRTLQLDPPEQEEVGDFDPILLGIGLDALASWRAESTESGTQTRIGWGTRDGFLELCWEERLTFAPSPAPLPDGPSSHPSPPPHSLVLTLLARILEAHGGRLEAPAEPALRLKIRWPRFQSGAGERQS
jgi:hypothetical protein